MPEPTSLGGESAARVERIISAGPITMRDAAEIYGPGTHKSTPTRHALKGIKRADGAVVRLEAIRIGGSLRTSRAAVLQFLAALQDAQDRALSPTTPAQLTRAAESAHALVAELLGAQG